MSAKAIENGEGFAADALLQESQSDEEEEPSQPSSAGSAPGGPPPGPPTGPDEPGTDSTDVPKGRGWNFFRTAALAVTGGVVAVGAVPLVLGAAGFTSAGIAASSLAAKMMSATAIASGGGVPAGSLVATLQSVGAAGLSASSNILLGLSGSSFGAWLGYKKEDPPPSPDGPNTEAKRGPHGGDDPEDGSPQNDKPPASQNGSEKDEK